MSERRLKHWKEEWLRCFLARDIEGIDRAQRNIKNWMQWWRNEREALEVLDREGKQ